MSKKILAMVLSMVMCLSFAACGEDDDSSSKKSKKDSSVTATDDSKGDESKEDESKEDESKEDESSKDESKPDSSVNGNTVTGKGYTLELTGKWLEYKDYKETLKNAGKNVILMQPFGSEFSFYNGDDLDPATDGVGVFYTAKPQSMSAYKGHKITEDMFVKALVPTIENQYKKLDGGQFTNEGSVNVGGAEALKLVGSGKVNDKQVKDVRYVLISGSTLYQFVFSIPEKDFAALSGDIDTIMKSVKFTEE